MKSLTKSTLATIFVFLCSIPALTQDARCTLKLNQAPALRGFKLGMTTDQLLAKLPGLKINPANKYGYRKVLLISTPNELSIRDGVVNLENSSYISNVRFPDFKGLKNAIFEFLDDRIFTIQFEYDSSVKWQDVDEFVTKVATALNLPKDWQEDDEGSQRYLQCAGFRVIAELPGQIEPVLLIDDPSASLLIKEREGQKEEKRRGDFKP